jgi:uncharacterized membrane protein YfcA
VTIFIIVGVFSIVQSLFGVGLLVFGTPTLMLLDYPFPAALAILLPASLTISSLQLLNGPPTERAFLSQFAAWCLAPLAATLALALSFQLQTSLNLLVSLTLALFVMLRTVPWLEERAKRFLVKHQRLWFLLMGVVHGISNLGGGLLTILASFRTNEKERIRHTIALCYSSFAVIQLGVLAAISPGVFSWRQWAYAALAAFIFLSIGQQIFRWLSAPLFSLLFTGFMACYAALLGLRAFGLV